MSDSDVSMVGIAGIIVTVGTIISMGGSFLFRLLLARELSATDFGAVVLVLSVVNIGGIFYVAGMNQGVTKFLSESNSGSKVDYGTISSTLLIVLLIASVFSGIGLLFSDSIGLLIFEDLSQTYVYIALFCLPLFALLKLLVGILRGWLETVKYTVISKIIRPGFLLVFGVAGAVLFGTGIAAAAGVAVAYALSVLIALLFIWRLGWRPQLARGVELSRLFKFSLPLMLSASIYILLTNIDKILISFFGSPVNVGQYEVAFALASLMSVFLSAFSFLMFPKVSELDTAGKSQHISDVYLNTTKWILCFTTPLFILLLFRPQFFISLFGEEYTTAEIAPVLALLACGFYFHAIVGPNGEALLGFGRSRAILIYNAIAVGMNILLNLLLIPQYGIVGAAGASFIGYAIMNSLKTADLYYIHNVSVITRYGLLGAVGSAMVGIPAAVLFPSTESLIIEGFVSGSIALLALIAGISTLYQIGGTTKADREIVLRLYQTVQNWAGRVR